MTNMKRYGLDTFCGSVETHEESVQYASSSRVGLLAQQADVCIAAQAKPSNPTHKTRVSFPELGAYGREGFRELAEVLVECWNALDTRKEVERNLHGRSSRDAKQRSRQL